MPYFEPLTTNHRVTMHGRLLRCPHCKHVTRTYHLGFSALQCFHCKTMVNKYDWTIGPNVTRKDLQPRTRYKAERNRSATFAKTKKILMSRLSHPASEYTITKETIPGWSRPDLVLVIDRRFDRAVQVFSDKHLPDEQSLEWADSSGNRSVHLFMVDGEQQDLPFRTFQLFKEFLLERHTDVDLLMIREDPGLGIFLPELDEALMEVV
jgi:glutaredoxin